MTKWQQQPHLGACWKCRFPGSSPDLVRNGISGMGPSKLYHNKYSGIFLCLVNFRSSESVLLPYPRGDLVKEPISPKSHTWLRASHGEEANRCLGEGSPSQGFPSRQARLSCWFSFAGLPFSALLLFPLPPPPPFSLSVSLPLSLCPSPLPVPSLLFLMAGGIAYSLWAPVHLACPTELTLRPLVSSSQSKEHVPCKGKFS